jgi:hypothetical protein
LGGTLTLDRSVSGLDFACQRERSLPWRGRKGVGPSSVDGAQGTERSKGRTVEMSRPQRTQRTFFMPVMSLLFGLPTPKLTYQATDDAEGA